MFDIGLGELAVIAFIAVLVFGPDKLPELAKQAGRFLHKAKTFANNARDELRTELGPAYSDLELRDLDPRTIVRKHVIEAMEDAEAEASPAAARPSPARGRRDPAVRRRGNLTQPVTGSAASAFQRSRFLRRTEPPPLSDSKLASSVNAVISAIPRPFSAVSSGQFAR